MWGTIEGFHLYATASVAVCAAALLRVTRDPKTPPWMDVLAAIVLLSLAALFLGMIQSIFNGLPGDTTTEKDLKNQYQVALYLIPFFTAGLATNLLSNVILSRRDYADTLPFQEAVSRVAWAIALTLMISSGVGLLLYAIYKAAQKSDRK